MLFDCGSDFRKTSAAVARRREAEELFRGSNDNSGAGGRGDGPDAAAEHLLRERNAIDGSVRAADSVLGQAEETRRELRGQGDSLRRTHGVMGMIAANIPGADRLIVAISKKRNLDDKVLSGVVAACLLFTMWYLFG